MGRIVDLCGEIAAAAEEGEEGLMLPPDAWDQLRQDWSDEDIEDALSLVTDSLLQAELVEAADALSAQMLDVLGSFSEDEAYGQLQAGHPSLTVDAISSLAHRVERLEEILEAYRDGNGPDRSGFDALRRRLADYGIEAEMETGRVVEIRIAPDSLRPRQLRGDEDEPDENE